MLQLVSDADGSVVDTTTTDRNGNYRFTGVQIGDFTVRPVLQNGWQFTTASTSMIDVTRGVKFTNVNFGVQRTRSFTPTDGGLSPVASSDFDWFQNPKDEAFAEANLI
jgi:hypothetical protein